MEQKPSPIVQSAWRLSSSSDSRRNSFVGKLPGSASHCKHNVEGVLRDMVMKSPAKTFYDENAIRSMPSVGESPRFSSPAGEDGYITANDLSVCKSRHEGDDSFRLSFGYSIKKNPCWSGSGKASPSVKYRDIPNRRSDDFSLASPSGTSELSSLRAENERLLQLVAEKDEQMNAQNQEMEAMKAKYKEAETRMKIAIDRSIEKLQEGENLRKMAWEEVQAMNFFAALQEQKIAEAENQVSTTIMDCSERLSSKSRKYKQTVRKMNQDHQEYEVRANSMIAQLTEQMSLLQTMAMGRIEALESELMKVRRENEELASEAATLRASHAAAESHAPSSGLADWMSPPTKFTRRNSTASKRRSSAMFRGGAQKLDLDRFRNLPSAAVLEAEEDEAGSDDDADTVVDEGEARGEEQEEMDQFQFSDEGVEPVFEDDWTM